MTDLRVLIADPDLTELHKFRAHFLTYGCVVVTASGGFECVEALRVFKPDVLLIDEGLRWGGYDGVLACLSHDGIMSRVPLIIVTTRHETMIDADTDEDRSSAVFLRKPFRFAELLTIIRSSLAERACVATAV